MPTPSPLRASLVSAKERLAAGHAVLQTQHAKGAPALALAARRTALIDAVIIDLFEATLRDLGLGDSATLRRRVALVPHGSYGRRALAPGSDIDLMVLYSPRARHDVIAVASRLMQDLYDTGLELGHSLRTPVQASRLARDEATIFSTLIEARLLHGSDEVFEDFRTRYGRLRQRRPAALIEMLSAARDHEQAQFGETVYLLEPNVKRSGGGLRDVQLLRWLGYVKFGEPDPERLRMLGALSRRDERALRAANEFLMRVRTDMHFCAGKAQDVLARKEQVRLAEAFGFRGNTTLLPVEAFMREYFRHTRNVRYLARRFAESTRPAASAMAQVLAPVLAHRVAGDYLVGQREISATSRGLEKLKHDIDEVLRLAELASLYDKRIAHATWATVYRAAPHYTNAISAAVGTRFLSLMAHPARLAELLRSLHELRVLEKIVPAFSHVRCLLQFNEYHKYTVDEHCIRAVEFATKMMDDDGPVGRAYRRIQDKHLLHLALLLHDVGKGLPGDHSEVGRDIAQRTALRLHLPRRELDTVVLLVHKHLQMSHLAFRRDTGDESLLVRFAVDIGSPQLLRMLYVLTCADLAAVGPGVLNNWKLEVLTQLYVRTMRHLGGDTDEVSDRGLDEKRNRLRACFANEQIDQQLARLIDALPPSLLLEQTPDRLAASLRRLRALPPNGADAWGQYTPATQTVEFLIAADSRHANGLFSRLTGALTSQGVTILSAQIGTLPGGLVLDRFVVDDPDFSGPPTAERIAAICGTLIQSICSRRPPTFRRVWGGERQASRRALSELSSQVRIDNGTSAQFTILEVFTFDSSGLLYRIGRELNALNLSIGAAKIGTYLDQVVDVFYVTDMQGNKIDDDRRLEQVRQRLLGAIDGRPPALAGEPKA